MDPTLSELLSASPIAQQVCDNLTFQEANQLRTFLKLKVLPCSYPIVDSTGLLKSINVINNVTAQVYILLDKIGSADALLKAVQQNKLPVVSYLYWEMKRNSEDYRFVELFFAQAFVSSVRYNREEIIDFFLENAINPNLVDSMGQTALYVAVATRNQHLVEKLLQAGADPNFIPEHEIGIYLPLNRAIENKNLPMVKYLVKHGANVDGVDLSTRASAENEWKVDTTPLIIAARQQDPSFIKYLLSKGAQINKISNGETALSTAIRYKNKEVAELLFESGADINLTGPTVVSPLAFSIINNWLDFTQKLLEKGANVHYQDIYHRDALSYAMISYPPNVPMVKLLIRYGATLTNEEYNRVIQTLPKNNPETNELIQLLRSVIRT